MTEEEEKKLAELDAAQADAVEADEVPEGDTQAPVGPVADEAPAEPEIQEPEPEPTVEEPEPQPRMFSQEEVNAIVGKARMEARQRAREEYAAELRGRYGLQTDAEIDDMVGNGQRFEALNGEYESLSGQLADMKAENALLKSGIPEQKFDDVKAILAYNKMDVTPENIAVAAATHPEWTAQPEADPMAADRPQPPQPVGMPQRPAQGRPAPNVVPKLGGEPQGNGNPTEDEQKAAIMKLFGR